MQLMSSVNTHKILFRTSMAVMIGTVVERLPACHGFSLRMPQLSVDVVGQGLESIFRIQE